MWLLQKVGLAQRSEAEVLLSSALAHQSMLLPLAVLDRLAELSFDPTNFAWLSQEIERFLTRFEITVEHVQRVVKMLIVCKYVLLHGPSAFMDFFMDIRKVLSKYSKIKIEGILGSSKSLQEHNKSINQKAIILLALIGDGETLRSERMKSQMLKKAITAQNLRQAKPQVRQSLYSQLEGLLWQMDEAIGQLDSWLDQKVGALLNLPQLEHYEDTIMSYQEIDIQNDE